MVHRPHAAFAVALALALLITAGAFVRSSQHVLGTSSPSTSASFAVTDDARGDVAVTTVPHPLLVGLFLALSVAALVFASPRGADASEARRARGPPSR